MSNHSGTRIKKSADEMVLRGVCYGLVGLFALLCLFPFVMMVMSSFMKESEIVNEGYKLIPKEFTLSAYEFLLSNPKKMLDSYKITIFITAVGTVLGLFFMSMAGFVLNRKEFMPRNIVSFFIYFTTLFSGGLIPSYILMVKHLGLKDSLFAMILPGIMSAWSIFLMRNFMKSIPDSLYESATMDGAGDFRIYWQIFLPLAIPSLATVGLFLALGFWNEWYNAMLYIQDATKFPLQFFLQKMVNQTNIQTLIAQGVTIDVANLPTQSVKMATAVLATGPIILLYPFVQRYFVGGLTIGAVKG